MKIDTHVVQPSILYNLDMTHIDFTEYHNCFIDNKELIKKYEDGEEDDKTKLIKNELININNYFEKEIDEQDKFNIYLFNEWKDNDRYSEIRYLMKDFYKNIIKIFSIMYDKEYPHYLKMDKGKGNIFNKENDIAICSICLKTSIIYYINPIDLNKNDDTLIQTILKDDIFFSKVFCLYYFIQAKHQFKNITNDYYKSLYIKNILNAIIYSHHQYYINLDKKVNKKKDDKKKDDKKKDNKKKDDNINLYHKLIIDKINNYIDDGKAIINIEKKEKDYIKNNVDTATKKKIEKKIKDDTFEQTTENLIININGNSEKKINEEINRIFLKNTSWGKITGFLHYFFTEFVNNFFYYFSKMMKKNAISIYYTILWIYIY